MSGFSPGTSVHVLGVGGAGMSSLAVLLHEAGCLVSGCDARESEVLHDLRARGIVVSVGHDPAHLDLAQWVTASPALTSDSPEWSRAHALGLARSRAQLMASLCHWRPTIAFAGTHGKTTTTSMAVQVWTAAHRDASWLLGAPVRGVGAGGHCGDGSELLVEADESYGTFGAMTPRVSAVTSVDPDHLDFYGSTEALELAFDELIERTEELCVVASDNAGSAALAARHRNRVVTVGRAGAPDVRIDEEIFRADGSTFTVRDENGTLGLQLAVPGAHNVSNAALVAAIARRRGVSDDSIVEGLANFRGAPRRFERHADIKGALVVDDYAHLPGEIAATIAATAPLGARRRIGVFQPHRVTRTESLAPTFAHSFDGLDVLIVTDIYTAGEPNPHHVTGELIAQAVRSAHGVSDVRYAASLHDAAAEVRASVSPGDLILTLGAGDVAVVLDLLGQS